MKKRVLSLLVCASLLAALLAGCGTDSTTADGAGDADAAVEDTGETADDAVAEEPEAQAVDYASMSLQELYDTQNIGTEDLTNARDLGGYVGADGRTVKKGRILRASRLSKASESDISILVDGYHLCQIIDFRAAAEIEDEPDPEVEGATYNWLPFYDEATHGAQSEKFAEMMKNPTNLAEECYNYIYTTDYTEMYTQKFDDPYSQQQLHEMFEIMLDENNEGAILFHCTSGKDRTGVAAVLILEALGVDEEIIMKDFEASNIPKAGEVEYLENMATEAGYTEEEVYKIGTLAGVNPTLMEEAIAHVKEEYGSFHDYLINQIGLTEEELTQFQDMYLE